MMTLTRQNRHDEGFTLVELLIVITIVGVLAAVAVPVFLSQTDKADLASAESEASALNRLIRIDFALDSATDISSNLSGSTYSGQGGSITFSGTPALTGSTSDDYCAAVTVGSQTASYGPGCASGGSGGGGGGGGSLSLTYADTSFTTGSNNQTLSPTLTGASGAAVYSYTGTLPTGVTFDTNTGTFTGPADSAWNFTPVEISAATRHVCALLNDGTVKCWGDGAYGQLGDNNLLQDADAPVDVVGLTGAVTQVATGQRHTCVVTDTGGAKCWGNNATGQIGDNTTTQRETPVDVSGLSSGVTQIAAGLGHTCALMDTGGVKCWGSNQFGQLGDGTSNNSNVPVDVTGLSGTVTQLAAGVNHTCALLSAGGVECWGMNTFNQLGTTTTPNPISDSVIVSGFSGTVTQIDAGQYHTCALLSTGGVECWGQNSSGQLGDGTTNNSATPVSPLASGVTAVGTGWNHSCALMNDGTVQCWGRNNNGQLVDGSTTNRSTPAVIPGLTGVTQVIGGERNGCALIDDGSVECWGQDNDGELGNGGGVGSVPTTPVMVAGSGPLAGLPAAVTVNVADTAGSTSVNITLTQANS